MARAINRLTGGHLDPPFADAVLLHVLAFVVVQADADLVLEYGGYVVGAARVRDRRSGSGGCWRVSVMVCLGFRILRTISIVPSYADRLPRTGSIQGCERLDGVPGAKGNLL
jgi:hypothetical protein